MSMTVRYQAMSAGHPTKTHADEVGEQFADTWGTGIAGYSQGLGYGPYTMAPGQKIHIIIAEGVAGLSREKNREVGTNWLAYYNNTSTPVLKMPNGSATTEYTAYKKAWVQTGVDSILQTFQRAVDNYISGYAIPKPPPPPDQFNVASGADQIFLKWSDNATTWPHFNGYVIYRSKGNVLVPETVYEKIFECTASYPAAAGFHEYKDTSAQRGFVYYYYIQTKDDGSTNNIQPGVPLVSSKFWTIASQSARLLRPSGNKIQEVRVVPNPYDLRSRRLQFADAITGFDRDQIAFYGLPPKCNLRIYTERRDLIWQKDHQNGTGDEFWNSQTQYGQIVVSGIYILHVEVTEDIFATEDKYARRDISDDDGKTIYRNGDLMFRKGDQIYRKGDSIFRKFVIIR
jgi:hypothetical protein